MVCGSVMWSRRESQRRIASRAVTGWTHIPAVWAWLRAWLRAVWIAVAVCFRMSVGIEVRRSSTGVANVRAGIVVVMSVMSAGVNCGCGSSGSGPSGV